MPGAPIPELFDNGAVDDLSIEISVEQVRQANAAECPSCGRDLRETFEAGRCSICGFYYNGDHLSNERQDELDHLQDKYN